MDTTTPSAEIHRLPKIDFSDCPTGCCPRFNPDGWVHREIHFEDKLFVRARSRSVMHVPINMGSVFQKTYEAIDAANAKDIDQFVVLSYERSSWSAEHSFAVCRYVPGLEMLRMSGTFLTNVFEGPYADSRHWCETMKEMGGPDEKVFFFYTTCPKCQKEYGKNYVVGFVTRDGHNARQHEPAHITN